MGNKVRGTLPPILKDHAGYHITHTHDPRTGKHTGLFAIYAGKNMKKDDFKSPAEALTYINEVLLKK